MKSSRNAHETLPAEELLKQSRAMAQELRRANAELHDKADLLAAKNREVEQAKKALEEKAEQLALASRYKSEFLANMSHELRTPLNNLLILSRMLAENSDRNLTSKQVKFAETIHTSGIDLLGLINDILDLSKIESGKMEVDPGTLDFAELQEYCSKTFRHTAEGKGLDFTIELGASLPQAMETDGKRLQQVIKNLLSNALKFTERGSVKLVIDLAASGWSLRHKILSRARSVISFSVIDTGIGVAPEKQRIIFDAFQQADGTTSRKYGGTGLGLSISRELTRLLGGEIRLESAPGRGSAFTLYLPEIYVAPAPLPKSEILTATPALIEKIFATPTEAAIDLDPAADHVADDRDAIQPGDPVLLIVEDDAGFARMLIAQAQARGWKILFARSGGSAIALAKRYRPGAITLDVHLPDMAGWALLDRLKHDPSTRHIPVHVISEGDHRQRGLALGAANCVAKSEPLDLTFENVARSIAGRLKHLLLICANPAMGDRMEAMLDGHDVEISRVATVRDAELCMREMTVDGILIDRDSTPSRTLERLADITVPVLILASGPVRVEAFAAFRVANSLERLLDESMILFHRDERDLEPAQRQVLEQLRETEPGLAGRTVLIVDDDVRNIFALTSLLEDCELNVLHAEDGRTAIDLLKRKPEIDLVLMDIMIPEMDGYETMQAIRQSPQFRNLPLIALTAKAGNGDRAKCLEAGASDCISKPVDLEQLFSILRVWIGEETALPTLAAGAF